MVDSFPDCDANDLQQLKESAENSNTKKSTKTRVTVWTTWAEEKEAFLFVLVCGVSFFY